MFATSSADASEDEYRYVEETVKKFIKWICNKFELPSEDEIVRNFEKETGNSLNAEKQFAKQERFKDFEKEFWKTDTSF